MVNLNYNPVSGPVPRPAPSAETSLASGPAEGAIPGPEVSKRVILVEDSSVTQDLVQLILTQRNHVVDIFSDGASALQAWQSNDYDLALIDFHLPDMTGPELVVAYLESAPSAARPYLVAITGDVKGLQRDPAKSRLFDRIMPKPLDIDLVCDLVEATGQPGDPYPVQTAAAATSPQIDAGQAPEPIAGPEQTRRRALPPSIEALELTVLHWPPAAGQLGNHPSVYDFDAVYVHDTDRLSQLWRVPGAHLLPVIDLTGQLGASADLDASNLRISDVEQLHDLIHGFYDRRTQLQTDLVRSNDLADQVLGRIYVCGKGLEPRYDGADRRLVAFNTTLDPEVVIAQEQALASRQFLETAFFDRFHLCGNCSSARFNVREECPTCRSSDLQEESYIHHFRCAYQGPESDFRQDDDLICPKCRRELSHFGNDYDRPGQMVVCNSCRTATSEPAVGFVCTDCGQKTDGDAIKTRDVAAAVISDEGLRYLKAGASHLSLSSRSLRFADLSLELVIALNKSARSYNTDGTPFVLCYIAYEGEQQANSEFGSRQVAQARKVFLEAMLQALPPTAIRSRSSVNDYILLPDTDATQAHDLLEKAHHSARASIRFDLAARLSLLGAEDLAA
uniref:TackOD1 domain-containing metal-binding protein n=1 Tax=Pararhizobium sp. IMCC3301 TaxID=3067904 RepID=UPI002740B1CD|nr:response regulator [Pararhizobium sp. IMCC3301]